ncbi:MAG: hypothetical protein MUD08_07130 [Cytophagales bacterium]|nr:hypothetical protein [Cytophagales bacterium]
MIRLLPTIVRLFKKPALPEETIAEGFIDEANPGKLVVHRPLKSDGKSLAEAIESVRSDTIENLYVFKNGRQIMRFRGEENYVNPTESSLMRLKDAEIVHNHPFGSSFSLSDIKAIVRYDASRMILATAVFTYTVTRPMSGWKLEIELIERLYKRLEPSADHLLDQMIRAGVKTPDEKHLLYNHYIWQEIFSTFDIPYAKIEKK